jgi:predicted MPP superfamily phosphohydrolase
VNAKVRTLVNEHFVLRPSDGGGIILAGVDDFAGARYGHEGPNLDKALAGVPDAPRILLAHQPQFFKDSRGRVDLQLSGHVHGGQVNPIIRPAEYVLRYVAGRYEESGSTMWVNRGFGTAGPPARLGSPPEITRIVLVSG